MSHDAAAATAGSASGRGLNRFGGRAAFGILLTLLATLAFGVSTASAVPPKATFGTATAKYITAEVTGTVDPGDQTTFYNFQYSHDPATEGWFDGPEWKARSLPANAGVTPVSEELYEVQGGCCSNFAKEIKPGTHYLVRLVAYNETEPPVYSEEGEFTTLPVTPPTIASVAGPDEIGNHSASISAVIERAQAGTDPALEVNCRAEVLSDAEYGNHSEKDKLVVTASGGTFEFFLDNGGYSPPLAYNATAAAVRETLEAYPGIGAGNVTVTGGPGSPTGAAPYTITFTGALANQPVAPIYLEASALTGESPSAVITTVTKGHTEGFEGAVATPCRPKVKNVGTTTVAVTLTGLTAKTKYHVRLVTSNAGGRDEEVFTPFTTTATPEAATLEAESVEPESAVLGGRVNPNGSPFVAYQFEWGTTTAYGNLAPEDAESLFAQDETFHTVTTSIGGLAPSTEYHYRVVAINIQANSRFVGEDRTFTTPPAGSAAGGCPNETSRTGPSSLLPDCRAYEWVTPDSGGIRIEDEGAGGALPDGSALKFATDDAPETAVGSFAFGLDVARRGPDGWSTKSFSPYLPAPQPAYLAVGIASTQMNSDYTEGLVYSAVPLAGPSSPQQGLNFYIARKDGSYSALTAKGAPFSPSEQQYVGYVIGNSIEASADWTHFFFRIAPKQLVEDPVEPGSSDDSNTYEWVNGKLRLVGYLPDGTLAPQGVFLPVPFYAPRTVKLPPVSHDGSKVVFTARNYPGLYVRIDDAKTVEASESQRASDPPGTAAKQTSSVGISANGSTVLFTSTSELTNDADTGTTEGVPNEKGSDLYSYDTESEVLTDLTPDGSPADEETGANVTEVLGATGDGSYVYFMATGNLAPGGVSGRPNIYVEHGDQVYFVATGVGYNFNFYVTPDGQHAAFGSAEPLTGYDSAGHTEIYKYTYRGHLQCASCRPDGQPATGDANLRGLHAMSDDGKRVFFQSSDAVLPAATNGRSNVYEYEEGQAHLLTPGDGNSEVVLFDISASGDDAFILTHQELVQGVGSVAAIYDARVDAQVAKVQPTVCQGESCRGAGTAAPNVESPGQRHLRSAGADRRSELGGRQGRQARDPPQRPRSGAADGRRKRPQGNQADDHRSRSHHRGGGPQEGRRQAAQEQRELQVEGGSVVPGERRQPLPGRRAAEVPRRAEEARPPMSDRQGQGRQSKQTREVGWMGTEGNPKRWRLAPAALVLAVAALLVLFAGPASAYEFEVPGAKLGLPTFSAEGINEDGSASTAAGARPWKLINAFSVATVNPGAPINPGFPAGDIKDVSVELPPGIVGNAAAYPRCTQAQMDAQVCPEDAQIGIAYIPIRGFGGEQVYQRPVFNMDPPPGMPAQFAFRVLVSIARINFHVRTGTDYGVTATVYNINETAPVFGQTFEVWGVPGDPSHDPERYDGGVEMPSSYPKPAPYVPFLNNPTSCGSTVVSTLTANSWQEPGTFASGPAALAPGMTGCADLEFEPTIEAKPTTNIAESPSGLAFHLHIPQAMSADKPATAHLRDVRVALPPNLNVNPAAANGLAACTPQQIGLLANGNEKQVLHYDPKRTASFTVTFDGQTTGPIPAAADAGQVQAALRALPGLDGVTVEGGIGGWIVEFGGSVAGTDVPSLSGTVNLDAVQKVDVTAEGGSYSLGFGGAHTGLKFKASFTGGEQLLSITESSRELHVGEAVTGPGIAPGSTVLAAFGTVAFLNQPTTATETEAELETALSFEASAAMVQEALREIPALAGNVTVFAAGTSGSTRSYEIVFGGSLAGTDPAALTSESSLTGTGAGVAITPQPLGSAPLTVATMTEAGYPHFTEGPSECPDAAKLGTVRIDTPDVLDHPLEGNVYLASQNDNPFNSLLAIYLAVDDPKTGLFIKIPARIEADPQTGQLTTASPRARSCPSKTSTSTSSRAQAPR